LNGDFVFGGGCGDFFGHGSFGKLAGLDGMTRP